jgi:hypothetical protein
MSESARPIGNVAIGVFPRRQEVLVAGAILDGVARDDVAQARSAKRARGRVAAELMVGTGDSQSLTGRIFLEELSSFLGRGAVRNPLEVCIHFAFANGDGLEEHRLAVHLDMEQRHLPVS